MVSEAMLTWEIKMAEEAKTGRPAAPDLTQEEMMAMLERVRGANNGR